jgi:alpha-D-xyloside xylohydrolase
MRRALLLLAVACGGGEVTNPSPTIIELGDGCVATLRSDGSFDLRRDGEVLVSSPSLLSRALDPDAPDVFHDPKKTDGYAFERVSANMVFESPAPGVLHVGFRDDGSPTALVRISLAASDDFYTGLGERFDHVSARGSLVGMQLELDLGSESGTTERHVPVPFLVSSKGWGLFVASREAGAFDVASTHAESITATFEGRSMDAYFFTNRDPIEDVAAFVRHVGLPRKLPRWALGPMLWHNEWTSQAELIAVATEIRKRHIPTTTLWIDNPWQTAYNTFRFDPARFPDPPSMMSAIGALGFRAVAWSTPYLEPSNGAPANEAQELFDTAKSMGFLVKGPDGQPILVPGFDAKRGFGMIDFTNEGAQSFWASLADRAASSGISGFKLDYGEDLIPSLFGARFPVVFSDKTTGRTARTYPLGYHAAYHRALDPHGGGITIVRASTYGGWSQADIIWPGDLDSGFEHFGDPMNGTKAVGGLPSAVVAAQSLAASGFPSFGSDTGGFRHGKPTKEALLRWSAHTALSVVMQLGGGGDSHDPWTYDEETAALYGKLASLHQSLVPYLSSLLREAETRGTPTIRPLPLAFPGDVLARDVADHEYMLGPDILVACVVDPGVSTAKVHLPPGKWLPFEGGAVASGQVDVPAPLGKPIAFLRAGALVPLLPSGIDTLAQATDPTVVLQPPGAWEARGFVSGNARASFDDGSALELTVAGDGIHVRAKGSKSMVVSLDLELQPVSTVIGASMLASEGAVRASTTNAATLSGETAVLKIVGDGEVVLR